MLTAIVRSVFQEDNKYYQQIFLDERIINATVWKDWYFGRNWY